MPASFYGYDAVLRHMDCVAGNCEGSSGFYFYAAGNVYVFAAAPYGVGGDGIGGIGILAGGYRSVDQMERPNVET